MKTYTVTGIAASFAVASLLALDDDQLERRKHQVETVDDDVDLPEGLTLVRLRAPVQFKRGENVNVVSAPAVNPRLLAELAAKGSTEANKAKAEVKAAREHGAAVNRSRAKKQAVAKKTAEDKKAAAKAARSDSDRPRIYRAAKKLAEEKGVDLDQVKGTGKRGAITVADVRAHMQAGTADKDTPNTPPAATGTQSVAEISANPEK